MAAQPEIRTDEEIIESLYEIIQDGYNIALKKTCQFSVVDSVPEEAKEKVNYIELQYYLDRNLNRMFIEFEVSKAIKNTLDWHVVVAAIHLYINDRFQKKTEVYPEIIAYDDGKNERYDSVTDLSPYTIGYWNCLHGHYEYLYSHQVFMNNMAGLMFPNHPQEFWDEMEENYNTNYLTDFELFLSNVNEIRNRYNIYADKKPEKEFEEFIAKVAQLRNKYKTEELTPEQKSEYISRLMADNGRPETVTELNDTYGIDVASWKKIPNIVAEYKLIYRDFFKKDLPDIISNTKRVIIVDNTTVNK